MSIQAALMMAFTGGGYKAPASEITYTNTTGGQRVVNLEIPAGVYEISFVLVAGGNGAGSQALSSGTTSLADEYFAYGSIATTGGTWFVKTDTDTSSYGGGNGGDGGTTTSSYGAGGGGAGGYTGKGGDGGASSTSTTAGTNSYGGAGGGVGLYGQGTSGYAGSGSTTSNNGTSGLGGGGGGGGGARRGDGAPGSGGGGSGGTAGTEVFNGDNAKMGGSYGGGNGGYGSTSLPKGGGALFWKNKMKVTPGQVIKLNIGSYGAARIIMNGNRSFPLNAAPI